MHIRYFKGQSFIEKRASLLYLMGELEELKKLRQESINLAAQAMEEEEQEDYYCGMLDCFPDWNPEECEIDEFKEAHGYDKY